MREWFENEAFWRELYPYMFDERRFSVTDAEVRGIVKLTGVRRGAVLDLCCGPGRHSVALAKRGFQVTGVDRTRFLLNKARQRARAARVRVEFIESDMRDFVRAGAYRLVLSLFTSFGYFDKKDEDRRVLRNIFTSLKSNGVCVIDLMGKERLAKIFVPTTSTKYPDGALLIQRHEAFDDWTRIRNEWMLVKGNRARWFKFHHTVYSAQELKDRLLQAGFADVKLYGDFDSRPYGTDSPRLVAVARKG
ncbi:MAG TPA: methyltransferase domain-containing protein [Verrucomicrobiae bacterium]|nr:methyltransferase domain-containing protein [Verrucomicrobiae bacterium]